MKNLFILKMSLEEFNMEGNPLMPFMGLGSPFGDFFGPNLPKEFFGNQPQGKMKTHALGSGFVISAKSRILGAGPYDDFLQTDAAINPGNSGGPLFNMNGEVIGINTAIISQGQGIGFVIPVNIAKELLPKLKTGKVVRGWLGIMIQDITPELAKSFGLKSSKGVIISDVVKGSPAEKAGLLRGDDRPGTHPAVGPATRTGTGNYRCRNFRRQRRQSCSRSRIAPR